MSILKPGAANYLKTDHVPEKILEREEQQEKLKELVYDPIRVGESPIPTIVCFGASGTGKTVTVTKENEELKHDVMADEDKNVSIQYINGRRYSTYHQILTKVLDNMSEYFPISFRGNQVQRCKTGWSSSELYEVLEKILKEKEVTLLLTLDEIDKLRGNDDIEEVISTFYDLNSEYEGKADVSLIAISNDPHLLEGFDEDIERRIVDTVQFNVYNALELKNILKQYAELCLNEGTYDEGDLSALASTIAQKTGSATKAKKILYYLAKISEGELNRDKIPEAEKEADKNMLQNEIESKPIQHKMALLALSKILKNWDENNSGFKNSPTTGNVHKKYKSVCRKYDVDANSRRSLTNYMEELEKSNLVSSNIKSFGKGNGLSTVHKLNADPRVVEELIESNEEDRKVEKMVEQ